MIVGQPRHSMVYRFSRARTLCLALGSLALALPTAAEAQVAARTVQARADRSFTLTPQSACLRLSTMQISTNSQQGMRSGAQNHNSSRSNRTEPMARPSLVTDDVDGDGFPDMFRGARIRIAERPRGARSAASAGVTQGPEIRLEIGDPDSDDDTISDLVNATTFRVTTGQTEARGNPGHIEAATEAVSPLFEGAAAPDDAPIRTWTYALVPSAIDPDSDQDGYGDALVGATVQVSTVGGRFHVDLQLAESAADASRTGTSTLLEAPSFSISKRSARTGR